MTTYNDCTEIERYLLVLWTGSASLINLLGNTLVLIATVKYHAIRLDKVSVVLIKNLAVADLLHSIYGIMIVVGLVTEGGAFTSWYWCLIEKCLAYSCGVLDIWMMCALNISKLSTLLNPLGALLRTTQLGLGIVIIPWVGVMLLNVVYISLVAQLTDGAISNLYPYYHYTETHQCKLYKSTPSLDAFLSILKVGIPAVAMVIIVTTTAWLLCHLHKVRGLQKQSLRTVLIVSTVFVLSYTPYGIYHFFRQTLPIASQRTDWFGQFHRAAVYLVYWNFAANPFIYYRTISSFNKWCRMRRAMIGPRYGRQESNSTSTYNHTVVSTTGV